MPKLSWDEYGLKGKHITQEALQGELDRLQEIQTSRFDSVARFQNSSYLLRENKINILKKELGLYLNKQTN